MKGRDSFPPGSHLCCPPIGTCATQQPKPPRSRRRPDALERLLSMPTAKVVEDEWAGRSSASRDGRAVSLQADQLLPLVQLRSVAGGDDVELLPGVRPNIAMPFAPRPARRSFPPFAPAGSATEISPPASMRARSASWVAEPSNRSAPRQEPRRPRLADRELEYVTVWEVFGEVARDHRVEDFIVTDGERIVEPVEIGGEVLRGVLRGVGLVHHEPVRFGGARVLRVGSPQPRSARGLEGHARLRADRARASQQNPSRARAATPSARATGPPLSP